MWTQQEGIALCRTIETFSPTYGAHVALTGGLLYRDGPRKDCDIVVYRIRQAKFIDWAGFNEACGEIGLFIRADYGFCSKAEYGPERKQVDLLFPEFDGIYGAYGDFEPVTMPEAG